MIPSLTSSSYNDSIVLNTARTSGARYNIPRSRQTDLIDYNDDDDYNYDYDYDYYCYCDCDCGCGCGCCCCCCCYYYYYYCYYYHCYYYCRIIVLQSHSCGVVYKIYI